MSKFKESLQGKQLYLDIPTEFISGELLELIKLEVAEFSSVFHCEVLFQKPPANAPQWNFQPRESNALYPALKWFPEKKLLVSYADNSAEALQTFNLVHSLAHSKKNWVDYRIPQTTKEAACLVRDEVLNTFPSFELKGVDSAQWAQQFDDKVPESWEDFACWVKEIIAQLQDAHTSVLDAHSFGFTPPYRGYLCESGIVLHQVPVNSAAAKAGVGIGWTITIDHPGFWLSSTGATPQQHSEIAARKALTISDNKKQFTAVSPYNAQEVSWVEAQEPLTLASELEVAQLSESVIKIILRSFSPIPGILSTFKDLCRTASQHTHMILDLRGNVGGNLVLARELQSLFLKETTWVDSVSFTDGCRNLGPKSSRWSHPNTKAQWPGTLEIWVDSMTYSAAEDFVLGLKGLEHVTIRGTRTGGGSGRPRTIPLGPHLFLRISTAITFDRNDSPVEHFGIEPDVLEEPEDKY